jgi:hypothetical protein
MRPSGACLTVENEEASVEVTSGLFRTNAALYHSSCLMVVSKNFLVAFSSFIGNHPIPQFLNQTHDSNTGSFKLYIYIIYVYIFI